MARSSSPHLINEFMTTKKTTRKSHVSAADSTAAVDAFKATLEHPFKSVIEAVRTAILGADSTIAEGIKWNSPSFRTTEYFATTNLREKAGLGIVLHLGAKVREVPKAGLSLDDPQGLLKWVAKDRAVVVFRDLKDFTAKRGAFVKVIQQWVALVW